MGSRHPKRKRSKSNGFKNGFQGLHANATIQKRGGDGNYLTKPLSGQGLYKGPATAQLNQHLEGCSDAMTPQDLEGSQPTEAYGYASCRIFHDAANGLALEQFAPCSQSNSPRSENDKVISDSQVKYSSAWIESSHSRPKGTPSIPVMIELLDDTITPWDLDLNAVDKVIRETGGDGVLTVKTTCSGDFVVHVCKSEAAVQLQLMTTLLGVKISASLSSYYHENMAKMRGVPLHMTNTQILKSVAPYGVIGARRGHSYTRLDNGSCIEKPKNTIILNFAPHVKELPASLLIEGEWYEVDHCVRNPVQCMNCYGYQHHARQCTSSSRCKLCAGYHFHKECNSFTTYRCVNCNGAHAATYSLCPVKCMYMKSTKGNPKAPETLPGPWLTTSIL
ncbi:hypothetical protein HPB48_014597 [Haemaphysalis longicornis]|uniref:Gag-like protein n=1 Tax=Haemaphysalis longicornis TaxID=44386 RepID=A0A9J6H038_HAELO|nr:hypothetical protein HPB48_014597 [Haemaphysalis longicornis]